MEFSAFSLNLSGCFTILSLAPILMAVSTIHEANEGLSTHMSRNEPNASWHTIPITKKTITSLIAPPTRAGLSSKAVKNRITSTSLYTRVISIHTSVETKTFTLVVAGDTSGDGEITILDLLQVRKHIKKDKVLDKAYKLAGDTSGDNDVTILDLLQIQKHIKGDKKL